MQLMTPNNLRIYHQKDMLVQCLQGEQVLMSRSQARETTKPKMSVESQKNEILLPCYIIDTNYNWVF